MNLSAEYLIAWSVYFLAAVGCCIVWWKITSFVASRSWRELLRGVAVVLAFTPWYAGDTPEFWAPAIVVLLMDLLLEGTASGLKGGVALLVATFLMLLVLTIRALTRRGRDDEGAAASASPRSPNGGAPESVKP